MPSLKERVTEWVEGRGYRMDASTSLDFLGSLSGGLWLNPIDETSTEVRFELVFAPRLGVLGLIFGKAWLTYVGEGMGPHILAGLEHHLSSGGKLGTREVPSLLPTAA